jgi:phthiodiolone/phenolphthiodiolone dimycocerosates ketoreductase
MGIGVGVQMLGRPPQAALAAVARGLEVAGADSFWAPDHWMGLVPLDVWDSSTFAAARMIRNPEESFDVFAFLTWLAGHTRKAKVATAVTEPIRRHPAEIAQTALSLHHLSRGRFVLGIGAGEKENVEPYGLSFRGQVSRLEEALYVIRLLWGAKGYVSYDGKFFRLDRAVIGLGPYRGTLPPVWVAAHGPRMLRLAGRYGDGWLPTHRMEPEEYANHLRDIRSAGFEAGRSMASFTPSYEMTVVTAETHDGAHKLLESNTMRLGALVMPAALWKEAGASHPLGNGFRGVVDWVPSRLDPDEIREHMKAVPFGVLHGSFDHGTPEQLATRIESYAAVGLRHVVLRNVGPLIDPRRALPSFRDVGRIIRLLRRR